jgi:hypothetical protein
MLDCQFKCYRAAQDLNNRLFPPPQAEFLLQFFEFFVTPSSMRGYPYFRPLSVFI